MDPHQIKINIHSHSTVTPVLNYIQTPSTAKDRQTDIEDIQHSGFVHCKLRGKFMHHKFYNHTYFT